MDIDFGSQGILVVLILLGWLSCLLLSLLSSFIGHLISYFFICIVDRAKSDFSNGYTNYFPTKSDFSKVFFLFLIWWTMNSKTWLSGVGTLCANAHYRASLFNSQCTLGFLSPPSNVGRCFFEPVLCGNIIASKIGKAVMDLELLLSSTQRIEPSITGKLIMSPFCSF